MPKDAKQQEKNVMWTAEEMLKLVYFCKNKKHFSTAPYNNYKAYAHFRVKFVGPFSGKFRLP